MPNTLDVTRLRNADPGRDAAPSAAARLRTRARLDAGIADEPAPAPARRRPPRRLVPAGALVAAVAAVVAVGTGGGAGGLTPAAAFTRAFDGDGVVHMTLVERVREGDREHTGPRTELWLSRDDGSWRTRRSFRGTTMEQRWDATAGTYTVDGEREEDDLAERHALDYAPLPRVFDPLRAQRGMSGARDSVLEEVRTTTLAGERLHELTLAEPLEGLDIRWFVTDDGMPRRYVVGAGDSALVTDVADYEVLDRG